MYESTPKTHFYSEWLQNPISSLSGKIFPQCSIWLRLRNISPDASILYFSLILMTKGFLEWTHVFAADLIRSAGKEIILIDNYVDESVLNLFTKRKKGVGATIYTRNISRTLAQDLKRHNSQYEPIKLRELKVSHDRFLIIDQKELYHIGASLKDLGKRWFAFSKMSDLLPELLAKLP